MPSKTDTDDILQETLLAAYLQRNALKNTDAFKPWLLRIAANKCNDFYRKYSKQQEVSIESDTVLENALSQSQYGLTIEQTVHETLALLNSKDSQILWLFYIQRFSQAEISRLLGVPVGTVKSRLHTAKQHFKLTYPHPPIQQHVNLKGECKMQQLPEILPEYKIEQANKVPFPVKWEEVMGWFIVPRLGEKCTWAMYDWPEKKRTHRTEVEVTGRAVVHGIEGVEIVSNEYDEHEGGKTEPVCYIFVEQLTPTHKRPLAVTHIADGIKKMTTFLDEEFWSKWGVGNDNYGKEIDLMPKGLIVRDGSNIQVNSKDKITDVVGRNVVTIGGKLYDCICLMYVDDTRGYLTEQFIDANGRTVLWRRFNRDDWNMNTYKQPWSEKLPDSQRFTVNGKWYVHWYDCLSDYIL